MDCPQSAPIETGDVLDIDIFVGENFEGNAQIYLPRRTELLAIASTGGVSDIQPRIEAGQPSTLLPKPMGM